MVKINHSDDILKISSIDFSLKFIQTHILDRFPSLVMTHKIGSDVSNNKINCHIDWQGILHRKSIVVYLIINKQKLTSNEQ